MATTAGDWSFEDTIFGTPTEPPDGAFRDKTKQTSYPTYEAAGITETYMGPTAELPEVPCYELMNMPLNRAYATKSLLDCP